MNTISIEDSIIGFPETRAFFLPISAKTTDMEIISNISSYAEAGFNVVLVDVFKNGWTSYQSKVLLSYHLRPINPILRYWQPLKTLFEESFSRSLRVYAVVDILCVGDRAVNKIGPILKKYPEWGLRNKNGKLFPINSNEDLVFLCPSNSEVRRFLGDLCFEILEKFPFDGIVIDLVKYPFGKNINDLPVCFCKNCLNKTKNNFESESSVLSDLADIDVKDILNSQQKIALTNLMLYISQRLQKCRNPLHLLMKISFNTKKPYPLKEPTNLWKFWIESGIFNEILLDLSQTEKGDFTNILSSITESLCENSLVIPILSTEDTQEIANLIIQTRQFPISGFAYSNPEIFEEPDLRKIRETIGDYVEPMEVNPLKTIEHLLLKMSALSIEMSALFNFFQDLLKFLELKGNDLTVEEIEALIENCRSIEKNMNRFTINERLRREILRLLNLICRLLRFNISFVKG